MKSPNKIIVAGINGFVGHHLAAILKSNDFNIIGIGNSDNLSEDLMPLVDSYVCCDLSDNIATAKLDFSGVQAIINLAGLANVGASFGDEDEYFRINQKVHTNICEAVKRSTNPSLRIIAVSTGAVYDSAQPMPLNEDSAVITTGSPYALSKLSMERALKPYQQEGMDIIIARPFNHTGPGQGSGFLVPDLLLQLNNLNSTNNKILVGNLKSKRDYTDVRDVARAYTALALAPKNKLTSQYYNICSGKSTSGERMLESLLEYLNLEGQIDIEVDQSRFRPNDPADIYGDHSLLTKDTGWEPTVPLNKTISDFIDSTKASI